MLNVRKKLFSREQHSTRPDCPEKFWVSASVQGQLGWYPKQPDLVGGPPAHGKGSGTR